jgi:hypothetical protein
MDPSQPAAISYSATALVVPSCTPVAGSLSSSASVLQWPQHTDVGHALLNQFNPNNAPLLPASSAEATAASAMAIVSISHTHQVISLKLTNTNYLYWRIQMKPYLLGQGVFGFVDGSNSCPSPHILAADGVSLQVSQLFLRWKQDQLILSALLSSLSMKVLHLVVNCPASCSVWHTLEQALASTSNSCIMQLHGSLQDLRQGDDSVTQFLQKAKTLFDELTAAGRSISLTDFNLYVFRGLRGEFKDLVTSLVTRADPLPYADLLSHLLTHEFIHKSSHLSMGSAAIHASLLPTPNTHLQHSSLTVSLLLSLDATGAVLMAAGVLNKTFTEVLEILAPGLIFIASIALPATTIDTTAGREIGSTTGDPIPATSYVKPSDTLLLSAPNFSNVAMDSNIVPIWHYIILQVLLTGFRTPVQINTSHLTLQP